MSQKKPTLRYYLGILKVIFVYVLASLVCVAFSAIATDEVFSFAGLMAGIVGFWAAPYSWYIEMYLGLYLLIPFLNLIYDGLQSKKSRLALLAVMLVLTALPSVVNIYRFDSLRWWLLPRIDSHYIQIMPAYWTGLYPITFFFLGRYLRDYPIRANRLIHLGLIVAVALANGAFNFYRSRTTFLIQGPWQDYGALPTVIQAVLVFSFVQQLNCDKLPTIVKKGLAHLSDWVLAAYLLSSIFDELFYPIVNKAVPIMHLRLVWFPVLALGVAVCSLAAGGLLHGLYRLTGEKLLRFLQNKFDKQG